MAQQRIALDDGKVAAGVHLEHGVIGLDIGKEFDAAAELGVGDLRANEQHYGEHQHLARMA
ncbi:MAG: hypothetical protein IH926_08170, partial [Proteobacteria bacterium]|nr:hypothetical protein [Pseudomonadota bacterium]